MAAAAARRFDSRRRPCERHAGKRHRGTALLSITNPSDDEPPLDPALLRVQARLRRLLLISGLTLGLGILAVFGAVIYRTVSAIPSVPVSPAVANGRLTLGDLGLPPDAKLLSTAVDGSRIALTYGYSGGNAVVFLDERTLLVIGRLQLPAGP